MITVWMVLIGTSTTLMAQKNERDYIRSGNRLYKDSVFAKAEVDYRKAIEQNPRTSQAYYNLGNALLAQGKPKEAMTSYEKAVGLETSKHRRAMIYHNMGVILQSQKQYAPAIDCYKNALRNNPEDDETRYNLILCQHQLKNNPGGGGSDNQNDDKEDKNGKDKNKEQSEQDKNKDEQEKEKDKQQEKKEKPQPDQNQMSKENAEQLLKAAMQDERSTQEKVKKAMQDKGRRKLDKDW